MTMFGYFLSCEEFLQPRLLDQAQRADLLTGQQRSGDHFHPWNDEQGQSPFIWSVVGALSRVCSLPVTTAVTCPTIRVHPALVAQAVLPAPSARGPLPPGCRLRGGAERAHPRKPWPTADVRLEMLEEAVGLMRDLWAGDFVSHRGRHYTVDTARIYTRTESPPPVYVSAFGPKAVEVAARIGDGYVTTSPDKAMVQAFRSAAGANKPIREGFKVRLRRYG